MLCSGKKRVVLIAPALALARVQDIQDSTVLWECMVGDIMNQALQTHNRIMRTVAAQHGGYESATGVNVWMSTSVGAELHF